MIAKDPSMQGKTLKQVITASCGACKGLFSLISKDRRYVFLNFSCHTATNIPLFNNAAQSYNHEFYWNSMKPNGGGDPADANGIYFMYLVINAIHSLQYYRIAHYA